MNNFIEHQDFNALKEIIENYTNLDFTKKTHKRAYTDSRAIFSKILIDEKHKKSSIARFLNKNHATVIHYEKVFDNNIKSDRNLYTLYTMCKRDFRNLDGDNRTNLELIYEINVLENKNKLLHLELEELKKDYRQLKDKNKDYNSTIELLHNKLRIRDIEKFNKRINSILNGY